MKFTLSVRSFQVPPTPGHVGLAAELAFGADFAGHAGHFTGEGVELVHHGVDGVLQLENFALHVHGDLAREVAAGHGRGDFGDVADLRGEVAGHGVDGVGEVLPGSGHAGHVGLAAKTAFTADLASHAGHFAGEGVELVDHGVDGLFQQKNFAADVDGDLLGEVTAGNGRGNVRDVADLVGQVAGHGVDRVGKVLPGAADARDLCLAAELAVRSDFASHAGDFRGEGAQLIDHGVDGVLQLENFALHVDGDLAREVAASHGRSHLRDVSDLRGQVAGHEVDVVGKVLPGAGDAGHFGLAAELAFGADFAGHAGDFAGEGVELVHHGVDGVLQLQNFALHVHGDLAREVAPSHGGRDFGDVADLRGEVAGHGVDRVGQILPGSGHAGHVGLTAQAAFAADFAGHAGDFAGETVELIDHGVERLFELQDFAAHIDGDLARKVAVGDGRGHFGDVAHLAGQVARP